MSTIDEVLTSDIKFQVCLVPVSKAYRKHHQALLSDQNQNTAHRVQRPFAKVYEREAKKQRGEASVQQLLEAEGNKKESAAKLELTYQNTTQLILR